MTQIVVFASFKPAPTSRKEFIALMEMMVDNSRQEPGCERYDLSEDENAGLHLYEVYADEKALQEHRETEHYITYRALVDDLLTESIHVTILKGVNVAT